MNSKRNVIILSLIIIMIIIVGVIYLNLKKDDTTKENKTINASQGENFIEFEGGKILHARESDYYMINKFMTSFLNAIAFDNNEVAYEMLDKKYIDENNITKENVVEKLKYSSCYQKYEATEIDYIDLTEESKVYIVYGSVREKNSENQVKEKIDAMINVDLKNLACSITPYKAGSLDKEAIDIEKLTADFQSIEKTDNNAYRAFVMNDKIKAVEIFDKYIQETLYYTKDAYDMIDEEYKNKRFGSLEKYQEYVKMNKDFINGLIVNSYAVNKKDGYTEYKIMDNYGNMYTFNVTNLLNYTVKMDDYTIDSEEFLAQYNSSDVSGKMSLNIGKFFSMINAKDYDAAYACLSEGFKQNYFKTVEDFKKYAEENFFKGNKLEGVSFESEGETHILKVKISDYRGKETKIVEKTFIMQLGEGTDFVMSFNVE